MKFAKNVLQIITGIGACLTLCAGKAMALTVQEGAEIARAEGMPAELIGDNGVFTQLTSIALAIVGALSVTMLIWGGVRYIISGGDSKKITDAKNTILYAIIGLIIAVLAYAIVRFVLNTIGSYSTPETDEAALQIITQFIA
jgi:cytochrome bd-type quinol oxidase subunit 2